MSKSRGCTHSTYRLRPLDARKRPAGREGPRGPNDQTASTWQQRTTAPVALGVVPMGLTIVPGTSTASASPQPTETYVVQMALDPVVAYEGGVAGLAVPKPAPGHKVDPRSAGSCRTSTTRRPGTPPPSAESAAAGSSTTSVTPSTVRRSADRRSRRVFSTPATGRCCGWQTTTSWLSRRCSRPTQDGSCNAMGITDSGWVTGIGL